MHRFHTCSAISKLDSPLRLWSCRLLGICGTLVLHAVYLQAIGLGASVSSLPRPEQENGPGASSIVSSGEFMTLVMVNLPGTSRSEMSLDIASRGIAEMNAAVQIASPDPTPLFSMPEDSQESSDGAADFTAGDPAVQSMLFGRYTGQINARIERAWQHSRPAVVAAATSEAEVVEGQAAAAHHGGTFRCTTRIVQDADGYVKEIELVNCNGTIAWQQSLVHAIQRASPLPAPPSPTVFTKVLMLTFEDRIITAANDTAAP